MDFLATCQPKTTCHSLTPEQPYTSKLTALTYWAIHYSLVVFKRLSYLLHLASPGTCTKWGNKERGTYFADKTGVTPPHLLQVQ